MGTQRRRRNKRTLAAREALWADFFKWCNSEGILNHQDDKRAAARYVATDLVADTGDVLLEVLVVTATESVSRPKRDLRKDEGRLTEAIGSVESVKSCWLFLAWSMAARSAAHADGADAALDASIHEDLARLIDALWPRSPDDEQTLDTAFRAEELGYWTWSGCLPGRRSHICSVTKSTNSPSSRTSTRPLTSGCFHSLGTSDAGPMRVRLKPWRRPELGLAA